MRILHTSDWHLGHTLHGFERSYEQRRFLDWLLETLEERNVDALLVTGDIFDAANPSALAQSQLYHFVRDAKRARPNLNVVLIGGNHDSPARLEAPSPLLEILDVHVIGQISHTADGEIDVERLLVPLKKEDGSIGAWCVAVPFLRAADVPRIENDSDAFSAAVSALYQQAMKRAQSRRSNDEPIIATGHCHMVGGLVSELSERRILIGGVEALSADVFSSEYAYVALGHLHRAQKVGGKEHVRYAGSPIPMSFGEIDYAHQVVLLELGEKNKKIEEIRVPRFVDLLRVPKGAPAPLSEVLAAIEELELGEAERERQAYLQVRVRLDAPEPGLRNQIETALSNKNVRLAGIEATYPGAERDDDAELLGSMEELARLEPEDVFRRIYERRFETQPPEELIRALQSVLREVAEDVS